MPSFDDKRRNSSSGGGPSAKPSGKAGDGGDEFSKLTGPAGDWVGESLKEAPVAPIDRAVERTSERMLAQEPPQAPPIVGLSPFAQATSAATSGTATAAATTGAAATGGISRMSVVGVLAVFAISVTTIGALGSCALAGFVWYALTPSVPIDPAAEPLIVVLKSEDATARAQAADGLGAIGGGARNAIPELKTLLEDKEDTVRLAAAKALANITGWPQRVKRIVGRRLVSRTEHQVANGIE